MNEAFLRQEIIQAAITLESKGLNRGASGNISVRFEEGLLITPSGFSPDSLSPDKIVFMDFQGGWKGDFPPSSEWRFHRDILATRKEINAIVHCHSPAASALSVLGKPLPPFHYMVAVAGGREVLCANYATFGSEALSDNIIAALGNRLSCLMAHHGLLGCGISLHHALTVTEEIEHLSAIYLRLLPLGEPPCLSSAEMERVLIKFKNYGIAARDNAQKTLSS